MSSPTLYTNNINNELAGKTARGNPTTAEVEQFISDKIEKARLAGDSSIIIKCGDIQKEVKGESMAAPICNAMRKLMNGIPHEVLYTSESGNSTGFKVEFFLKG